MSIRDAGEPGERMGPQGPKWVRGAFASQPLETHPYTTHITPHRVSGECPGDYPGESPGRLPLALMPMELRADDYAGRIAGEGEVCGASQS